MIKDNLLKPLLLSENKKINFYFETEKTYLAGLELNGKEVREIKDRKTDLLSESFVAGVNREIFLIRNKERKIKLLLNKKEVEEILHLNQKVGNTTLPTKLYLVRGKIKIELSTGRGRKKAEKKSFVKNREEKIRKNREIKLKLKY